MLVDLEKYLSDKREKLDVESPDDGVIWEGIRNRQNKGKEKTGKSSKTQLLIRIRNIAATIIILFSIGYITRDVIDNRAINRQVTLSDISEILGRREIEYKAIVSLKTSEVSSLNNIDNLIIREIFKEIKDLDVIYAQALKDLKEIGYNEKIVNTIFDTYEKKIDLLELVILESNKLYIYENNGKINL